MDMASLQALAKELAKTVKTPADLNELSRVLTKLTVESALNAELTDHLGYDKHELAPTGQKNARNGHSRKRLKTGDGEIELQTPRKQTMELWIELCRSNRGRSMTLTSKLNLR